MKRWKAVDAVTGEDIKPGDTILDHQGDPWTFEYVTRGTDYNGTAKIHVTWGSSGREFYAFRSISVVSEEES